MQGPFLLGEPRTTTARMPPSSIRGTRLSQRPHHTALYTGFLDRYGPTMTDDQKETSAERWVQIVRRVRWPPRIRGPPPRRAGARRLPAGQRMLFGEPGPNAR